MLTITEDAQTAIKNLIGSVEANDPGFRIFATPLDGGDQATLELALTDGPSTGDAVLDADGAQIFLESNAAAFLDDKVLDADIEGEKIQFSIGETPEEGTAPSA